MNDDQDSRGGAHAEENETVFGLGVFRIVEQAPAGIAEDGLGFFKPNAMLGAVGPVLAFVMRTAACLDSI